MIPEARKESWHALLKPLLKCQMDLDIDTQRAFGSYREISPDGR